MPQNMRGFGKLRRHRVLETPASGEWRLWAETDGANHSLRAFSAIIEEYAIIWGVCFDKIPYNNQWNHSKGFLNMIEGKLGKAYLCNAELSNNIVNVVQMLITVEKSYSDRWNWSFRENTWRKKSVIHLKRLHSMSCIHKFIQAWRLFSALKFHQSQNVWVLVWICWVLVYKTK